MKAATPILVKERDHPVRILKNTNKNKRTGVGHQHQATGHSVSMDKTQIMTGVLTVLTRKRIATFLRYTPHQHRNDVGENANILSVYDSLLQQSTTFRQHLIRLFSGG